MRNTLLTPGPAHLSQPIGYPVSAIEQQDFRPGDDQQPSLGLVRISKTALQYPAGAQIWTAPRWALQTAEEAAPEVLISWCP